MSARLVVFGGALAGGTLALGLLAGAIWPFRAPPEQVTPAATPAPLAPPPSTPAPEQSTPPPTPAPPNATAADAEWLPPHLRAIAEAHRRRCAARPSPAPRHGVAAGGMRFRAELPLTSLHDTAVHGMQAAHTTGSPVVLLLVAAARGGEPQCAPRDVFEATAWSDRNRALVSVLDLGDGLHRISFTPKMPGQFRLCLHLFQPSRMGDIGGWPGPAELDRPYSYGARTAQTDSFLKRVSKSAPLGEWCPNPKAEYEPRCVALEVQGAPRLPSRECPRRWSTALSGSWVRAEGQRCSPGICRGDLRFLATDGWVYVPDECYLRLYNPQSAWDCVDGKRLLWFGDSTTKQPATDLVEMLLRAPVLRRSFRWQRDRCTTGQAYSHQMRDRRRAGRFGKQLADMGCNIQFDHRQWLVTRRNPRNLSQSVRMRHIWGGGPTPSASPAFSPRGLDLLMPESWAGRRNRNTLDVFRDALRERPDAVFLHAFVWDDDAVWNFAKFEQKLQRVVNRTLQETPPHAVVHWASGHPQCLDDRDNPPSQCHTGVSNKLRSIQAYHNAHLLGSRVLPRYAAEPRLTFSDRYAMAEPHVMGPNYCHFGIHFGAHPQYCYMWEPADPAKCFRNWLVDKFEFMVWLNALCPAGQELSEQSEGSIEDGVLPADEPASGMPTENAF
eukprot:TRINITY_DN25162_c0_g1_i2.p1 TRINITY_DN25162_c0_g1~~TRINITY_DN25162_c0_g1_i2.p1  ORF type:complete len:700 (+),score=233.49 TRINITY_DN25162_c0_g1_i2:98-2101(+)